MGKVTGFMEYERLEEGYAPVAQRLKNYSEFVIGLKEDEAKIQSARCMDCGTPFCNNGCPVNNIIPDFNDLVYRADWRSAFAVLDSTNNFPEFTGRICPAPCEAACTLNVNDDAVGIKSIEHAIIDKAWAEGWVLPRTAKTKTGKKIAVVGSGPAGMAAAQQLARAGHRVTLFEKSDRIGGLLRYGIPDFKMEKWVIDRRLEQMKAEGVEFKTGVTIGTDITGEQLRAQFDAVGLTMGAEQARELPIPGRELKGVHLAMNYLTQQNKRTSGIPVTEEPITAKGKRVVIIGGGDTGSDCLGTAHRQGCVEAHQFELLPEPPPTRAGSTPWPLWPMQLRTSHAHEEGCDRQWSISTTKFTGHNGQVTKLHANRVKFENGKFTPIPDSDFEMDADLVLLAMGFTGPVKNGLLDSLGVKYDARGAVTADDHFMTNLDGVFAGGDTKRGASLIVWAIAEGRKMAAGINQYLHAGKSAQVAAK